MSASPKRSLHTRLRYLLFAFSLLAATILFTSDTFAVLKTGDVADVHDKERKLAIPQASVATDEYLPSRAARPANVLYDQMNSPASAAGTSQNFESSFNAYDAQAADDFVVPTGQVWHVDQVEVAGVYSGGGGPADSVNVYFYSNFGGYPGTPVLTQTNIIYTPGASYGDLIIPINPPAILNQGAYWVSVQVNQNMDPNGQWFWRDRGTTSNNYPAWRNPGGGFYWWCTNWARSRCSFTYLNPDQLFRLSGLRADLTTPTSTATGTPPTATVTRTPTPQPPTATGTRSIPSPVLTQQIGVSVTPPTATPSITPTPACGLAWRVVTSPNPPGYNYLNAVAAWSPTEIWAVGYTFTGPGTDRTLTMRWNGTQWTVIPSPNVGAGNNELKAVAVISPNDVWAVGYAEQQALTMHWNGIQWSVVPTPDFGPHYSTLSGVDAVASNDVWAVGTYGPGGSTSSTLIMRWDGTQWRTVPSPNVGAFANRLYGITAISANDIWAVGHSSGPERALALHWDGIAWRAIPIIAPPGGSLPELRSVSAVAPNDVWAVGYYLGNYRQTWTLHWDGSQWTTFSSPNPFSNRDNLLQGVVALASNDVWAVGFTGHQTVVEHWDGSQWSIVPSPNPDPIASRLLGVAAVAPTDVWAVGHRTDTSGVTRSLVLRYNDPCITPSPTSSPTHTATPTPTPSCALGWSHAQSPNAGTGENFLRDIAAVSANDIWAAGSYFDGISVDADRTLALRWNGTQWNQVPSPNVGLSHNQLHSVAVVSANDVWAVGAYHDGAYYRTLTLHWNGSQWSVVTSPNPGSGDNFLYGVEATSASDVWAAGSYSGAAGQQNLVLRWNGSQWTHVATPNPGGPYGNILYAVSAIAANDVWAVGAHSFTPDPQTLTLRWDGSQWTHVPSPSPGNQYADFLNDVDALAPDNVWAVGHYVFNNRHQTLTLRWDGSQWNQVLSPNSGLTNNYLNGVVAIAANDIWAVGSTSDRNQTLALHWDGTAWGTSASHSPGSSSNRFVKIAAVSSNNVWAVGGYSNGAAHRTLIERHLRACDTPTATPTSTPTVTASPTPGCTLGQDYNYTVTTGATIVPGTSYIPGSTCDGCTVLVNLPFSYSFYGTAYTQARVSNKGVVQFVSNSANGNNTCLPTATFNDAILAYWDEHNTNINDTMGIFTSVSGSAPNRIFNIEWRSGYVANDVRSRFQVRLYEGEPKFETIYATTRRGFSATVGVQKGTGERYTQYSCNVSNSVPNGTMIIWDQRICSVGARSR